MYQCPYCGKEKPSPNGTGSDVACCGEVGHCTAVPESFHERPVKCTYGPTGQCVVRPVCTEKCYVKECSE